MKSKNIFAMVLSTLLFIIIILVVYADGFANQPSHQTLYVDTLTSRTDNSAVNIADSQGLFVTGNVNALGNVGIGTTNPSSTLHVNGQGDNGLRITAAGKNTTIYLHVAGGNYGFLDLGGNTLIRGNGEPSSFEGLVGIGTTTPTQKLDVIGQVHATGDICTDAGGGKCLSTGGSGSGSSQWLNFGSNIYYNDGNVGIGWAMPTERLYVEGNIYIGNATSDALLKLGGHDYEWQVKRDYADSGKFKIKYEQGNLDALTIDRNGNVGIGTTNPSSTLHVNSATNQANIIIQSPNGPVLRFSNNDGTANNKNSQIQGLTSGIAFGTNSDVWGWQQPNYAMFIARSTGNVGINSVTPGSKVTVGGDVYIATSGSGIILKDTADSTCRRVVLTSGALSVSGTIPCPTS